MTSSTSSSKPADLRQYPRPTGPQAVLAIVGPLLLVGLWAAWFARVGSGNASQLDEQMAAGDPRVVVTGNSASHHSIDPDIFGAALGRDGGVVRIHVPSSRSRAWYAVVKNRIFQAGYTPDLIVVVASLHHMLDSTPPTARQKQRLLNQMGTDEPLLEERVFKGERELAVVARSKQWGTEFFERPKSRVIGLFANRYPALGILEGGRLTTREALDSVFDIETALDLSITGGVMPVASFAPELPSGDAAAKALDPDGSFVPDIAQIATDAGTPIVFVRIPLPADNANPRPDATLEAALQARIEDAGGHYLSLYDVDLGPDAYFDQIHMNESGRQEFTRLLAERLNAEGLVP